MHGGIRADSHTDTAEVIIVADQRIQILLQWCHKNSIEISPKLDIATIKREDSSDVAAVHSARRNPVGVLLKPNNSLNVDDIIAVVPKQSTFNKITCGLAVSHPTTWRTFNSSVEAYAISAGSPVAEVLILTSALALELAQGQASNWYGYLQSIATAIDYNDLPAFWTSDEASIWLQGTDVENLIAYQSSSEREITLFFNELVRLLEFDIDRDNSLDLPLFLQVYALVSSRAFWIDNYHGLAMVPIADAFDHTTENDVSLQTDDQVCKQCGQFSNCLHQPHLQEVSNSGATEAVEMVCVRARPADRYAAAEVFNSYGRLSNSFLLTNYGFRLDDNDDDRIHWFAAEGCVRQALPIDADAASQICSRWRQHLRGPNMQSPDHELLYIDADGMASSHMLFLLEFAVKAAEVKQTPQDLLVLLCRARLGAAYKPDMDVMELADLAYAEDLPRNLRLALQQTLGERQLLHACIENLRE